jgi:sepiapterin reductase
MDTGYWSKRTFCLITGASRGIGRSIAVEVSKKIAPGSVVLLLARSKAGLESTKEEILNSNSQVDVLIEPLDLSIPDYDSFRTIIDSSFTKCGLKPTSFEHAIIFQNAASLGIQRGLKVVEINELKEIQDYYAFNLNSFILLNTAFFSVFDSINSNELLRTVVHISSGGVIAPFKTWGLYCAAKSARNLLLKSMALESGIQALNYAPGSVDTAIYDEAVNCTADTELAKLFEEDRKAGKVLTCEQTVKKLLKVLASQLFIKGEHVSYHDVE